MIEADYGGIEERSEAAQAGTYQKDLNHLQTLITQRDNDKAEQGRLEKALKAVKGRIEDIEERQMPEVMDRLSLTDVTTTGGARVQLKESIHCSIPADKRERAYAWLRDNGEGGLIKTTVSVPFGVKEIDKADDLAKRLAEEGMEAAEERKVEPSTLRAWAKRRLEEGHEVPEDLFAIFKKRGVKIN